MRLFFAAMFVGGLTTALLAQDGPFGLHKGMTQEETIQIVGQAAIKEVKGDIIRLTMVPKPHPAFEFYSLIFSQTDGLLKICAYGHDIRTNGFGESVHNAFMEIRDAITGTYGKPEHNFDFVRSGSVWNAPEDWMMGLLKQERSLLAGWRKALPNHLQDIVLEAKALSSEKGYIVLYYEFEGWNHYVDELKNKERSVF